MRYKAGIKSAVLALCILVLSACATTTTLSDPVNDPWEGYNRSVHHFNDTFDTILYRPIASGYKAITPAPVREALGNMLDNLTYPGTILNLLLQGDFARAWTGTRRFLINSTVGILGVFDVATAAEIPLYDEDFGQTLAVWGWDQSRYFVLPFFGPSTIRDGFGRLGNGYLDPVSYLATQENIWTPWVLDKLHVRLRLMGQEDTINSSYDPYIFIRDAWLQNREFKIYNGDPPALDYESFLEE